MTISSASPGDVPRPYALSTRRGGKPPQRGTDGVLLLRAEGEWILSGDTDVLDDVKRALPAHSERIGPEALLLSFGNSVGRLDLPHLGRLEIFSGKWDEDAFDRMLSELVKVAGSLPFSFGVGPLLPQETTAGERERILYHAFLYLRHVLSENALREDRLLPGLELILREPHRRWRRTLHSVPLEETTRIDPGALVHLAGGRLRRADCGRDESLGIGRRSGHGVRRLANRLGGHLPERIREQRVESELDTPENRFVLHFLRQAQALAWDVAEAAAVGENAFSHRLNDEAKACVDKLGRVLRAPLWAEVGAPRHLSLTSTVLQGRRGYRDVFRHWLRLRQGTRLPMRPSDARQMVEAKDVALLYELWCYFRVVDQLRGLLGPPEKVGQVQAAKWETTVRPEYRVTWSGVTLDYNGRFSKGRMSARRAYSTPLRPDIVLTDRRSEKAIVHLLDAKFRVDLRPERSPPGGTFKREDLAKMHAYRDAILAARTAWILYPGADHQAYYVDSDDVTKGGVGAIPLVPGKGEDALQAVIRGLLS